MDDRILNEILNELKEIKNILITKLEKPYFPHFEKRADNVYGPIPGVNLTTDYSDVQLPETQKKRGRRKKE